MDEDRKTVREFYRNVALYASMGVKSLILHPSLAAALDRVGPVECALIAADERRKRAITAPLVPLGF